MIEITLYVDDVYGKLLTYVYCVKVFVPIVSGLDQLDLVEPVRIAVVCIESVEIDIDDIELDAETPVDLLDSDDIVVDEQMVE